ncbi:hypothetical protein [Halobacillus salinus]|uniref:Uncharacterized protein n=1 Tax=Halobacillus salinus TaxID=192814 RepID=A0A4Z0H5J1_9BACI|nr:hypothetical protein [Halobacillus salinus]TGB04701.1 hypothetical protein E4663_06845 [Halobacillus salinus]
MKPEDKEKLSGNANQLLEDLNFKSVFKNSISLLKPSRNRFLVIVGFAILIMILYYFVLINSVNGIEHALGIVNYVTTVSVAILALIITGYAIFQALATGETLIGLLKTNQGKRSYFLTYNNYFFAISLLYLTLLIVNFVLFVVLSGLPTDWALPYFSTKCNNMLYSLLMVIYLSFVFNSMIELKSFVFNLYSVFSTTAVQKAITKIKETDRSQ